VVALLLKSLSSLLFSLLPCFLCMSTSPLHSTNEQEEYRPREVAATGPVIQDNGVYVVQKSSDGGAESSSLGLCHVPGGTDVSWRGSLP